MSGCYFPVAIQSVSCSRPARFLPPSSLFPVPLSNLAAQHVKSERCRLFGYPLRTRGHEYSSNTKHNYFMQPHEIFSPAPSNLPLSFFPAPLSAPRHPNVSSQNGAICLDILKDQWTPALTLKTAMLSLQALLSSPEPNDPQDAIVAKQVSHNPRP